MLRIAPRRNRSGWIYVLDNNMGHWKIGRTRDLSKRIKTLRIQLPFPVTVWLCFFTEDAITVERELHEKLATRRLNGEWFGLEDDDLKAIFDYCGSEYLFESENRLVSFHECPDNPNHEIMVEVLSWQ